MTPKRRDLILRVADGHPETFQILHHIDRFKYADQILSFFIKENFTGKAFVDLYRNTFKYSWLSMGKWAIMKIKKEREFKPVIGGQDYRV